MCRTMYPVDSIWPLKYRVCSTDIFHPIGFDSPGNPTAYKPVLLTPTMLILEQLQGLVNQPGIEEALDAWQTKGTDPDKIQSMADGRIWKEIQGADGHLFFENGSEWPDPSELQIGVTVNYDG